MFQPFDRAQEFETTLQLVVNGYINGPSLRLRINWKKERADFGDEIDLHGNLRQLYFADQQHYHIFYLKVHLIQNIFFAKMNLSTCSQRIVAIFSFF